ncbi:MAG TPA: amidohydrolase [Deltaproteobacteria bacterium]|nr:amidohydrolase [Deltaproteobacteria bacterium]
MKTFYDIHFHAFNLSHPNLLAFISRMNLHLLLMTTPVSAPMMGLFGWDKKIKNLLTMVENDIGNYFLILEYYLRKSPHVRVNYLMSGDSQYVREDTYHKIALCPLIMDFGYKNILSNTFYRVPAQKPVAEQTTDLLNGINFYNRNDLRVIESPGKIPRVTHARADKKEKLCEIYPFLGLNTANYTLSGIIKLLDEYFCDYDGKRATAYENMGSKQGFAGIKLYPPLGFDPWPENKTEKQKTDYLYSYCEKKQIPLTTHCSDGGFAVCDETATYTNPARWRKVLEHYPQLKINFAHMGKQSKKKFILFSKSAWQDEVLALLKDYPNAYTDFSCAAFEDKFYRSLARLIQDNPGTARKILFGTDFMINLLWCGSYNEYLEVFLKTKNLASEDKQALCSDNPARFLWQ